VEPAGTASRDPSRETLPRLPSGSTARLDPWALFGWGAVGLLGLFLLWSAWQGPDIFYHLALGQRVLQTGEPQPPEALLATQPGYVNIYWLFQVVAHGIYGALGPAGVSLLMLLGWAGALLCWARTCAWGRWPAAGIPFLLGALFVLQNRFDPRPEVFSYLFLALQLHWLATWDLAEAPGWRRYAAFAAVQVLWGNVHGYFVLGPLLAGLRLAAGFIRGEKGRPLARAAALLAVALAASLVSPFGVKSWAFAWTLWSFLREMGGTIVETRPPLGEFLRLWTVKLFWAYWAATLLAGLWLAWRRRFALFPLLTGAAGLYLSASAARNLPLLFFLSAPLWRGFVEERRGGREADRGVRGRAGRAVAAASGALALAACVWVAAGGFHRSVTSPTRFGAGLQAHAYPLRAAEYLRSRPFAGRLYNNSADGGYLEYAFPGVHPYIDSRYIEAGAVRTYFASLRNPQAFAALHREQRFDAALLSVQESAPLVQALIASPEWRLVHADPHRALFAARGSEAAGALAPAEPRFYAGDDLALPVNGRPAIEWTVLLVRARRGDLLLAALRQFAEAPRVPSMILQYGLGFGQQTRDREVVAAARALVPRMIAPTGQDRRNIERLMRETANFAAP